MSFDFAGITAMRNHHPAWRLLCSPHAPLIVSFLHRIFITPNVRFMAASTLAEALGDELYTLRESIDDASFKTAAMDYLNDWSSTEKGWLRKFYHQGSDEPQFDLTPSTEKAIAWLTSLTERSFVGTESRLLTLFDLLKQMSEGSETDPDKRVSDLLKRRAEIDAEILRVRAGNALILDETALKDRFQQFMQLARELLTDFREVEHNFRVLDRRVREQIALWEGGKGELLEEIMGERDAITDSDQGRSFRAFWEFLMSSRRQEELSTLLAQILSLPSISQLKPDARIKRVHYDWLEAGEQAQRTVAQLSQQLRRFLDDQAWLENRRIMDLLHAIEAKALDLRESPPEGYVTEIMESAVDVNLPLERPLYMPALKPRIGHIELIEGNDEIDASLLYSQIAIDREQLVQHIHNILHERGQVTLSELIKARPLRQGLAELVTYLQLGADLFDITIEEETQESIYWENVMDNGKTVLKQASVPRIIFVK